MIVTLRLRMDALACGRFVVRWAGGGWDDRAGDFERGGMKVVAVKS